MSAREEPTRASSPSDMAQETTPVTLSTLLAEVRSIKAQQEVNNRLLERVLAVIEDKGFALKGSSQSMSSGGAGAMAAGSAAASGGSLLLASSKLGYQYAVVQWYNYRKELGAGFIKGFHDKETAAKYAYCRAVEDAEENGDETKKVITEDEITDGNGPGKDGSPYAGRTIVGYGGRSDDGYATTFYCVVPWFEGVENEWDQFKSDRYWEAKHKGEWYPKYSY
jgi:hypothetical protein